MDCYIDSEACIACGLCQTIAPKLFDYDDQGIVQFCASPTRNKLAIPTDLKQTCQQAVKKCPTRAIFIK